MNNIIIIKKIKMCRIGHSSALCGRELARRELARFLTRLVTIATPVNIPAKPHPYESSPRYGHPEVHRAFGRDISYKIILYY